MCVYFTTSNLKAHTAKLKLKHKIITIKIKPLSSLVSMKYKDGNLGHDIDRIKIYLFTKNVTVFL